MNASASLIAVSPNGSRSINRATTRPPADAPSTSATAHAVDVNASAAAGFTARRLDEWAQRAYAEAEPLLRRHDIEHILGLDDQIAGLAHKLRRLDWCQRQGWRVSPKERRATVREVRRLCLARDAALTLPRLFSEARSRTQTSRHAAAHICASE